MSCLIGQPDRSSPPAMCRMRYLSPQTPGRFAGSLSRRRMRLSIGIIAGAIVSVVAVPADAQSQRKSPSSYATQLATAPASAEERTDLEWIRQHTQPGVPYELDLSQPNQYRFVLAMLRRGGESKELSPHMFSLLEAKSRNGPGAEPKIAVKLDANGAAAGTPQALTYVNQLNATGLRSFAASGLSSVNGGTDASTVVISLLAGDRTYAANSQSQYAQGTYFTVPVNGSVPNNIQSTTTEAQAMFAYVPKGGNDPIVTYYRGQDTINPTSACMQTPNYCVRTGDNCIPGQYQTACTNAVTNTTPIKVCYYRGSQQECDYYNKASAHPTNFVFPLQGYVQFSENILAPSNTPTGAVTITLENWTKGGGCYLKFRQLSPLDPANWSVPANTPTQLNWNFSAASFPDPNSCLEYYGGTNTYLHVQVLGLVMTSTKYGQFEFTGDRSQSGQPGIYIVPWIQIQQGCMAAGTQIRLADGSQKAIETFAPDRPDVVKSAKGDRTVLDVTSGIEPLPMIRLRTDKGQEILVTRTHPIITPSGPVPAESLKPGAKVMTESGPATLTAAKQESYRGKVFNLRIGGMEDPDVKSMTLQANGFIVGDARMQDYYDEQAQKRLKAQPAAALQNLPPEWREDFRRHQRAGR